VQKEAGRVSAKGLGLGKGAGGGGQSCSELSKTRQAGCVLLG
jgi:hypothetical protein